MREVFLKSRVKACFCELKMTATTEEFAMNDLTFENIFAFFPLIRRRQTVSRKGKTTTQRQKANVSIR